MKIKSRLIVVLLLGLLSMGVFSAAFYKLFIDNQYVRWIYFPLSHLLRRLWGAWTVSVGDLLYTGLFFVIIGWLYKRCFQFFRLDKSLRKQFLLNAFLSICIFFLSVYVVFNLFWGLNYHRTGVEKQLAIPFKPYTKNELVQLNNLLVTEVNERRGRLQDSILHQPLTIEQLRQSTFSAYWKTSYINPIFRYSSVSIKSSLFSKPLSYWGISGYYNPFTGEAQVNTAMPSFLQPFTCCHEVAHQLGFAKENEANFIGFIAASESDDEKLQYAAAFEMMLYANRNLQSLDTTLAASVRKQLSEGVRNDWKKLIAFSVAHQSNLEPLIDKCYDLFLKSHQQPEGLVTYERVVGLLIGYYQRKGLISPGS